MIRKFIYSEKTDTIYFDAIKKTDAGTAIIFLHGLVGSRRSWGKEYHVLSKQASLYFIDLLGFGFSAKPNISYTLENHIEAAKQFIEKEVKEKNVILVGHSFGALIALGYTSFYPERIKKTILLALPYYHSAKEAYATLIASGKYTFVYKDTLKVKIFCTLVCSIFGSLARQITPLIMRDLPRGVVQDAHRHSYHSYMSSLTNVLYNQNLTKLLSPSITKKILLIHGSGDKVAPLKNIEELVRKHDLSLTIFKNAVHRFPIYESELVVKMIEKEIDFSE